MEWLDGEGAFPCGAVWSYSDVKPALGSSCLICIMRQLGYVTPSFFLALHMYDTINNYITCNVIHDLITN